MTPAEEKNVGVLGKTLISVKRGFADALEQIAEKCAPYCTGFNDEAFCTAKLKAASAENVLGRRETPAFIEFRIREGLRKGKAKAIPDDWRDPWEAKLADIPARLIHRTSDGRDVIVSGDIMTHFLRVPVASASGQRLAAALRCNGWHRNTSKLVKVGGKNFKGYWRYSQTGVG